MAILDSDFGISYAIIKYLVISEFLLIAVVIMATFVVGTLVRKRRRRKKQDKELLFQFIREKLHHKIHTFEVAEKAIFHAESYYAKDTATRLCPHHLIKIEILLPVFLQVDKVCQFNEDWQILRIDIIKRYLLKYAREHAYSHLWVRRLYAAEIFSLLPSQEDEALVTHLVGDRIHIVYLHAIQAALMCNSEMTIHAVIMRAAKMNWLTQLMYLEPFSHAQRKTTEIVHNILATTDSDMVKAICYRVLTALPPTMKIWYNDECLFSSVLPLRLSSLKYYVHIKGQAAIPMLKKLLSDDHWQVRLISVHRLGVLHATELLREISHRLNDSDWWVKTLAAHVLKRFGNHGYELIMEIDPELVDIDFNVEEHLKYTLW